MLARGVGTCLGWQSEPWPSIHKALDSACSPTDTEHGMHGCSQQWKQEDHSQLLSKSWDTWDLVPCLCVVCKVTGLENRERGQGPTSVCRVSQPEQDEELMRTKDHHSSRSWTTEQTD